MGDAVMDPIPQALLFWITAFELPALAGLLGLILKLRRDIQVMISDLQQRLDQRWAQHNDALTNYKLEALKSFATMHDVKDIEARLVGHLLRIEAKLDVTALKAESLSFRPGDPHHDR
jgi:preprotein translocase subunit SecA